jgi:hypothetical protein
VDYVSESGETAGRAAAAYAMHQAVGRAAAANATHQAADHAAAHTAHQAVPPPPCYAEICPGDGILTAAPQLIDLSTPVPSATVFFRVREERSSVVVRFTLERALPTAGEGGPTVLFAKRYQRLRPPEMERVTLDLSTVTLSDGDRITVTETVAEAAAGESSPEEL